MLAIFASCFVQTTNLAYLLKMASVWTRGPSCFLKKVDFVQICTRPFSKFGPNPSSISKLWFSAITTHNNPYKSYSVP